MECRTAREEDLEGLLALSRQLNPEDPPLDRDKALAIWRETASRDATRYFVADEDGVVVSACCVTIIPNLTRGGRPYAMIENVVTDEGHRRRGLGARVLRDAIEYAKGRGCYKVVLLSSVRRVESHRFYEAIGFDGNSKRGFELRFGRP
jgi:GNAT superfamily N-acetyltransferase